MHVVLLCATRRGYRFLQKLTELLPANRDLTVFSFREEPWEPPFLDDIRELALARGGRFFEARQVGTTRWLPFWEPAAIDLMLVVSWRYVIPASVYGRPRLGTFALHDSLLPEYRGFSPTVWAIVNGEDHTGVTLFQTVDDVDAGEIVDQERVPIGPDDPIALVMERVTETYLRVLERNLGGLLDGTAPRRPQDHAGATYLARRLPDDNLINWHGRTEDIHNLIRAVSAPYPGAYTYLSGQKIRVWSAERLLQARRFVGRIPGRVVEVRPGEGSVVLTGDGSLLLTRVQVEGDEMTGAADVLHSVAQTLG